MYRSNVYFKLDSGNVGGDNGFRAECNLKVDHTSTWEESHWMQIGLHCQVKPRLVSGLLKSEISCQRIPICVWTELC